MHAHEKKYYIGNQNRSTNVNNVKNLNGMHAQPGKRLNVSVPMVYCVDMLVQGTDVDEPGSVSLCGYQYVC